MFKAIKNILYTVLLSAVDGEESLLPIRQYLCWMLKMADNDAKWW